MPKVELIGLYGLEQSVMGSKFPMSVDVDSLTEDVTDTVNKLASSILYLVNLLCIEFLNLI